MQSFAYRISKYSLFCPKTGSCKNQLAYKWLVNKITIAHITQKLCGLPFEFSQARGTGNAGKEVQFSVGKGKTLTRLRC